MFKLVELGRLRRDLRSIELVYLLAALIISVTALSSVGFLADRLQRAFQFDARQLIAGDLLVVSDRPISESFLTEAKQRDIRIATTVVFPSMANSAKQAKLVSLKAVSESYPLRGNLQLAQSNAELVGGPKAGTVWIDAAAAIALNTQVGDQLKLGERQFLISGVLVRELDRGAGFMNFAPRVMMSLADLNSTGLIGLGSRVTYRALFAGSDEAIQAYEVWLRQQITTAGLRGIQVENLETAQPTMRKTLERAEHFLTLMALLTALIAAVAIGLATRRYVLKQADAYAILKCFGATQTDLIWRQLQLLLYLVSGACLVGAGLAWLVQEGLVWFLGGLLMASLPAPSIWPVVWSILWAVLLLFGFAAYPLLTLTAVSPIRVIRRELGALPIAARLSTIISIVTCLAMIFWAARDWKLATWVSLSFAGAVLIFMALVWFTLRGLKKWSDSKQFTLQGSSAFALRFALAALTRRSSFTIMQVCSLAIALMAMLLIIVLRQDLLPAWQGAVPANSPNRFVINIQNDQRNAIAADLKLAGIGSAPLYPMVRGRLVDVNAKSVMPSDYKDENAKRLVDREFNLSYTDSLPLGNRVIAGKWFSSDAPQISLESGIAKTLGLKLGDILSFEIAGQIVSAKITSLRKLDWSSMRVNFFVIMPPQTLQSLPQSWITSFYQPPTQPTLDLQLSQKFPNITVVDVGLSLKQIQDVIERLSSALSILFLFAIIAAILVLFAAIAATQEERFRDAALLKALGTSRGLLAQIAALELVVIGSLGGLLGGLAASAAAWALGRYVMEIEFYAFFQPLLFGLLMGLLACALAGYRFYRKIQVTTAVNCLREAM